MNGGATFTTLHQKASLPLYTLKQAAIERASRITTSDTVCVTALVLTPISGLGKETDAPLPDRRAQVPEDAMYAWRGNGRKRRQRELGEMWREVTHGQSQTWHGENRKKAKKATRDRTLRTQESKGQRQKDNRDRPRLRGVQNFRVG